MNLHALLATVLPFLLVLGAVTAVRGEGTHTDPRPPWWPDDRYVANGCYPSTAAYLQKLRQTFPGVVARAATVRLPSGARHTIAVVRWRHRNFGRDLFIGVFPIHAGVQEGFDRALARWTASGGRHGFEPSPTATAVERAQAIQAVAALVAEARPRILCVPVRDGVAEVLTWLTPEGELALYEPTVGTAVGPASFDPTTVARQLLARRG